MAVYQGNFPDPSQFNFYRGGGAPTSAQTGQSAYAASQQPDMVSNFLQQLMSALNEDPESGVAEPIGFTPESGAPLTPLGFLTSQYNPMTAPVGQAQIAEMAKQRMAYPQARAEGKARVQQQRVGNLTRAVNVAGDYEMRQQANDIRQQIASRPLGSQMTRNYPVWVTQRKPDGTYSRFAMTNEEFIARRNAGEVFESVIPVTNRYMATTDGIQSFPSTGYGGVRPTGAFAVPPTGVVEGLRQGEESVQALQNLRASYDQAREVFDIGEGGWRDLNAWKAKFSQAMAGREWTRDLVGMGIDPQQWLMFDTDRKRALNAYVKQQTGAQFSLREMDRYLGQFPLPWDDPVVIEGQLQAFMEQAVIKMNSVLQQYAALRATNPNAALPAGIEIADPNLLRRFGGKTAGDVQVGTKNGVPVYQRPDGTRYMRK